MEGDTELVSEHNREFQLAFAAFVWGYWLLKFHFVSREKRSHSIKGNKKGPLAGLPSNNRQVLLSWLKFDRGCDRIRRSICICIAIKDHSITLSFNESCEPREIERSDDITRFIDDDKCCCVNADLCESIIRLLVLNEICHR
jgi:hypothetical protein